MYLPLIPAALIALPAEIFTLPFRPPPSLFQQPERVQSITGEGEEKQDRERENERERKGKRGKEGIKEEAICLTIMAGPSAWVVGLAIS